MVTVTISEAQEQFEDLLEQAKKGETVIITSDADRTPLAKLDAILKPAPTDASRSEVMA